MNVELYEIAPPAHRVVGIDRRQLGSRYSTFLWSRALTISGGASEIMRGLIGRQLLGLPRA
jgi:alkylation response protein AidB-like acyl-CoA dehydrogenase